MTDATRNPWGADETKKWNEVALWSEEFRTDAEPLGNQHLLQSVADGFRSDPSVGALCMLVVEDTVVRIAMLYGLHEYTRQLHETNRALVGRFFAYSEDVTDGNAPLVEIVAEHFEIMQDINVYLMEHNKTKLENDIGLMMHPPIADGADGSELSGARKAAFVPFDLVPLLAGGVSAREGFLAVYAHMQSTPGGTAPVQPLIDLLIAGITLSTTAEAGVPAVVSDSAGQPFISSGRLISVMKKEVLHVALPGLVTPPPQPASAWGGEAVITGALDKLLEVQTESVAAEAAQKAAAARPKGMTTMYPIGSTGTQLRRLLQTVDTEEYPKVYQMIADKPKQVSIHTTVVGAITAAAMELNCRTPIVPVSYAKLFTSLAWGGTNRFNLGEGLVPSAVIPAAGRGLAQSSKLRASTIATNQNFSTFIESSTNMTSADIIQMNQTEAYIPEDYPEAMAQLLGYACVLAAAVGTSHDVFIEYEAARSRVLRNEVEITGLFRMEYQHYGPLMLIYYFDYHMRFYFEEQLLSPEAAELPPLRKGLRKLLMYNKVEDMMPAWKTNIQVSQLLLGKGDQEKGGSGLLSPTATTMAEKKPVKNSQLDARYTGTDAMGTMLKGRITALLSKAQEANPGIKVPKHSSGSPRCLSYHLKGVCYTNCGRANDHGPLTGPEKSVLFKYAESICSACSDAPPAALAP